MFQKLACWAFRRIFRTFTGKKYPGVVPLALGVGRSRIAEGAFVSLSSSPGAEGLYSWRFARIPSAIVQGWMVEHDSPETKSIPLPRYVAEHVSSKHVLGCEPAHGPAEEVVIEEFLHHETLKDSSFFWLDNNYSYFKRVGFVYLHKRRKSATNKRERRLKLGYPPDSDAVAVAAIMAQDRFALDAFVLCLRTYLSWLELRECCIPIVEAIWKEPLKARQLYGAACGEACDIIRKMTLDRVEQLDMAKVLVDIPMDWLRSLYSHIPREHHPVTRLRQLYAATLRESCSWKTSASALPVSEPVYRSTKIGYWYFGLLPDYLLSFYIKHVLLSPVFIWHSFRTGFLIRLLRMLFRRGPIVSYPVPALLIEGKDDSKLYEPASSRELPGFGFERLLRKDSWQVYLYAYLVNLGFLQVAISMGRTHKKFFEVFFVRFWQRIGVSEQEIEILEKLYERIKEERLLQERLGTFIRTPDASDIGELFQSMERAYSSLLKFSEGLEPQLVRKALARFYLHGYL